MIKLLVIFDKLMMGGTETRIIRVINGIDRSKYEISFIYNMHNTNDILLSRLRQNEKVRLLPIDKLFSFQFVKLIRKVNPDTIFTVSNILGVIIPRLLGYKNILNNEGGIRLRNRSKVKKAIDKYVIFKLVRGVVPNSRFAEKELIQMGLNKKKVHTIHNGVTDFSIKPQPKKQKGKEVNCVYVGRLYETKNQIDLIDVFNSLSDHIKEKTTFNLIGDGPCRSILENKIKKFGLQHKIILKGEKDDVDRELGQNDIFIFTAYTGESLPNAVVEAMKNALPIIAYNTAGLPELIEEEKNGFLIENKNTIEFASKLEQLINDEEAIINFSLQSRLKFEKEFTMEKMINSFEYLFQINKK